MQWGNGIPRDGTSRKMREYQIRFCERLEVKFLRPTRQLLRPTRHSLHWVMDMIFRDHEFRNCNDHAPPTSPRSNTWPKT